MKGKLGKVLGDRETDNRSGTAIVESENERKGNMMNEEGEITIEKGEGTKDDGKTQPFLDQVKPGLMT